MDIAVILPQLVKAGGAEYFALQCIRNWQQAYSITIYSVSINVKLLKSFGIKNSVKLKPILRKQFSGANSRILN